MPVPNNASLETAELLEAEMSGLRAQLTSLRSGSIDIAGDLLAILGPLPKTDTDAAESGGDTPVSLVSNEA